MKSLYKTKRQQGFTIVEVIIVLAIAALILLIVFLAVPALQRNSRNNGIRNDAAALLAGVNDYIAANNGNLPDTITPCNGTQSDLTVKKAAGGDNAVHAKVRGGTKCNDGSDTLQTSATAALPAGAGVVNVAIGKNCNAAATDAGADNPRGIIALYKTETGGILANVCLES